MAIPWFTELKYEAMLQQHVFVKFEFKNTYTLTAVLANHKSFPNQYQHKNELLNYYIYWNKNQYD